MIRMTYADVFMIGGGGGGGITFGGGGGAGAYFMATSMALFPGTYTISVGAGGSSQQAGSDTLIWHEGKLLLRVRGGSAGGSSNVVAAAGGCGGGAPAAIRNGFGLASNAGTNGTGFDGGYSQGVGNSAGAGGGGGCAGKGGNFTLVTTK